MYGTQPWTSITGVQATEAYGAQQENVGAALIALNAFNNNYSVNYDLQVGQLRSSVKAMLNYYKNSGIPAHFDETISCDANRQGCNTGITWSYARQSHTAATVYFGLALLYQFSDSGEIIEGANPYSKHASRILKQSGQTVRLPNYVYPEAPKPSIIYP